ncbi:MAG: hypothetical protein ACI4UN_05000 [Muribaculaceae bacterium]
MAEIFLVPSGGLANRMRSIASAIALAKALDSPPPSIVWICNHDLNAPFSQIFSSIPQGTNFIEPSHFGSIFKYEIPRKKNLFLSSIYQRLHFDLCIYEGINLSSFLDDKNNIKYDTISPAKKIFLFTGEHFFDYSQELYRKLFNFSDRVIERAGEITGGFCQFNAGMHIRRTDNIESISNSPLYLFEQRINELIASNNDARIFLATDDQSVKHHFSRLFPNNIIYNSISACRSTASGMIDGAAEMYILSQCNKIYGSYWSSYTEAAAAIGNKSLTVLKK